MGGSPRSCRSSPRPDTKRSRWSPIPTRLKPRCLCPKILASRSRAACISDCSPWRCFRCRCHRNLTVHSACSPPPKNPRDNAGGKTPTPQPAKPKRVEPPKNPAQKLKPNKLANLLTKKKHKKKKKPAANPGPGDEVAEPQQKFDPGG